MSQKIVELPGIGETATEEDLQKARDNAGNGVLNFYAFHTRERQLLALLQSLSDAGIEVVDGKVADSIVPTDRLEAIAADDFCEFPECSTHEPKIGICVA